jgi:hypothetical protein
VDSLKSIFTETHPVAFIEFQLNSHHRQGFSLSYLIKYTLESSPSVTGEVEAQRLSLSFTTADVALTGWRLDHAAEALRQGVLSVVKAIPGASRYGQLVPNTCIAAEIEITPVGKEG